MCELAHTQIGFLSNAGGRHPVKETSWSVRPMFLNSISRPKLHLEGGLAPRPAFPAAQLPLERREAHVAGPTLKQRCVRNDILVPAGMAARAHQVGHSQIFETEGVAWRHGMGLFIPAAYRKEQTMNTSTVKR